MAASITNLFMGLSLLPSLATMAEEFESANTSRRIEGVNAMEAGLSRQGWLPQPAKLRL
jgi:hypothetical protein